MSEEYSTAWLVDICGGLQVAVAEREMMAYDTSAEIRSLPLTPHSCSQVTFWGDRIVPLINLGEITAKQVDAEFSAVVIVAYQTRPKTPLSYVALGVKSDPVKIMVSDKQACDLPDSYLEDIWLPLALSAFSRNGQAVPILNIAMLCSKDFHDMVESS